MSAKVKLGIDRIGEPEVRKLLEGKRLGVLSAASGLASDYRFPIDILNEKFNVAGIFAPEHGPRGVLGPGEKVRGGRDRITGLPVWSLYEDVIARREATENSRYMPADDSLSAVDCVVYDMQDVGSRYFTYVSSLFYLMKVCGARWIPVVVLDRPNPLGSRVEGNVLDPDYSSFIGLTEVPIRHGMTVGELARLYNGDYGLGCELHVIEMTGWDGSMYWDDTGLPFVRPSPNLPTLDSVYVYNGICLFEGTNVSLGRGTAVPFTVVGAEYINPVEYAAVLNADDSLRGVRFSPAFFEAYYSKLTGVALYGVTVHVTDKRELEPVRLGVTMLRTLEAMYPDDFEYSAPKDPANRWHIDLAAGGTELRLSGLPADELCRKWQAEADRFAAEKAKYYLYRH
ncbi:MAG: DUF1343 domain-containing protein [Clostridiales bacterium]|nr:DUF1343 domain-containing protein [Clostridiales bacterium]